MALALLIGALAICAWFVRRDLDEYAMFKELGNGGARARRYRRWTVKSFVLFAGTSLLALALLGQWAALAHLPAAFEPAAAWVTGGEEEAFSGDDNFPRMLVLIAVVGMVVGGIIASLVSAWSGRSATLGDVEALVPRNGPERFWAVVLSINAGISEELFFRLTLPLLIALVTGSAFAGFGFAALIFGAVHLYQGRAGMILTALAGLFFSFLYALTGQLWVPMAVHMLMNVNGLIVQPWLRERFARR